MRRIRGAGAGRHKHPQRLCTVECRGIRRNCHTCQSFTIDSPRKTIDQKCEVKTTFRKQNSACSLVTLLVESCQSHQDQEGLGDSDVTTFQLRTDITLSRLSL